MNASLSRCRHHHARRRRFSSPASPRSQAPADARFEKIAALVQAQMTEHAVPGVAIGILDEGRVTTRAFGVTNVDHPLPVTDDTLFQIGSISKTFTGTAMMRLVEQGKVELTAPLRRYLPEFRVKDADASARATVQDTLTHMGGWEGDFFADPSSGDDALQRQVEGMATLEQTGKPGEMWGYNNAGFYAAGRVIEVITGQPFEKALKASVLDPLGLETAYFFPADVMTRRFVVGHAGATPRVIGPWPVPRAANAAGGITTNVATMLKYAAFHMGDGTSAKGERVLSAATLQRMRIADRAEGRQRSVDGAHLASRQGGQSRVRRTWRRHQRTDLALASRAEPAVRAGHRDQLRRREQSQCGGPARRDGRVLRRPRRAAGANHRGER